MRVYEPVTLDDLLDEAQRLQLTHALLTVQSSGYGCVTIRVDKARPSLIETTVSNKFEPLIKQ